MSKARQFAVLLLVCFALLAANRLEPVPGVDPSPIATDGLRVVVWEETELRHKLPQGQRDILQDETWRAWVESHGGQWRVLDATAEPVNDLPWVRQAWQRKRDSLPWYQAGNGTTGSEGALPAVVEAWDKILEPLGGTP